MRDTHTHTHIHVKNRQFKTIHSLFLALSYISKAQRGGLHLAGLVDCPRQRDDRDQEEYEDEGREFTAAEVAQGDTRTRDGNIAQVILQVLLVIPIEVK